MILVGNLGGRLKAGRFLQYPGYNKARRRLNQGR